MSMSLWAENEVRIVCEGENPNRKEGEFDYVCACYESALKAYKCLMEDNHSGMSIGFTWQILNRLLLHQPLTPIEDTKDIWAPISLGETRTRYQCRRMSSLFKNKYHDGRIEYHDADRVACYSVDNPNVPFHFALANKIIDEMYPITMPYVPSEKPFRVYTKDFLFDPDNGDYDTVAIIDATSPDGEHFSIGRYFKETKDGWEEISCELFKIIIDAIEERKEKNDGRENLEQTGELSESE